MPGFVVGLRPASDGLLQRRYAVPDPCVLHIAPPFRPAPLQAAAREHRCARQEVAA